MKKIWALKKEFREQKQELPNPFIEAEGIKQPGIDYRKVKAHQDFLMLKPLKYRELEAEVSFSARKKINEPKRAGQASKSSSEKKERTRQEIRDGQRNRVRLYARLREQQEILEQPNLWDVRKIEECLEELSQNIENYMERTKAKWMMTLGMHVIPNLNLSKKPGKQEIVEAVLKHFVEDHGYAQEKADMILENVKQGQNSKNSKRKGTSVRKIRRLSNFGRK